MTFEYVLNDLDPETFSIKGKGDMIGEEVPPTFLEDISAKISEGLNQAVFDLSDIRYINSSGIGVLITVLAKLRNKGGELILMNPSEKLNKLLAMTKLLAIFKIVDTIDNANVILNRK